MFIRIFKGFLLFMMYSDPILLFSKEIYEEELLLQKLTFASSIVDATFDYFKIKRILKYKSRPPWDLKNMMKLIHLTSVEKIEDSKIIEEKNVIFIISHYVEALNQVIGVSVIIKLFTVKFNN